MNKNKKLENQIFKVNRYWLMSKPFFLQANIIIIIINLILTYTRPGFITIHGELQKLPSMADSLFTISGNKIYQVEKKKQLINAMQKQSEEVNHSKLMTKTQVLNQSMYMMNCNYSSKEES